MLLQVKSVVIKILQPNISPNTIDLFKTSIEILDNLDEEIGYISHIVRNLITFSDSSEVSNEDIELNELIKNINSTLNCTVSTPGTG